jgi:citrate lyase beta subunit
MKNTTISSDLTKYITEVARRTEADRARARAIEMLDSIDPQQVHAAAEAYRDAKTTCAAASAIVAAIPKSRRECGQDPA